MNLNLETDDLKQVAFDDEAFVEYVSTHGTLESLKDLLEFKWDLTYQLELGGRDEDWHHRIVAIIIRVKKRITVLKRELRREDREDEMLDAIEDLRESRE